MQKRWKVALTVLAATLLTGCITPTLTTQITVDSKFSMTPEINPTLHAVPDWGDKITVVALDPEQTKDPLWAPFATAMKNALTHINLEVVEPGQGEQFRMQIGLILKKTRLVREEQLVPQPVIGVGYGWGMHHRPPPPRRPGHRGPRRGPHYGPVMAPTMIMTVQYVERQYWARGIQVQIDKVVRKGKKVSYEKVYESQLVNETTCTQLEEVLPIMIAQAIQHLYDTGRQTSLIHVEHEGLTCY